LLGAGARNADIAFVVDVDAGVSRFGNGADYRAAFTNNIAQC